MYVTLCLSLVVSELDSVGTAFVRYCVTVWIVCLRHIACGFKIDVFDSHFGDVSP